jgi:hypothetical protein
MKGTQTEQNLLKKMRNQHSTRLVHFILLPDVLAVFIYFIPKFVGDATCAGILEQSMGARNRLGKGCPTGPPDCIGCAESIP